MLAERAIILLAALVFIDVSGPPAHSASLALGCAGTQRITTRNKDGTISTDKGDVSDFSVVVDLDSHSVFGFWTAESVGSYEPQIALPIVAADPNSVIFKATRTLIRSENSIEGEVDRITGAVNATDYIEFPAGGSMTTVWDLHCKPTRPLF